MAEYGVIFLVGAARLKSGFLSVLNGENQTKDVTSHLMALVSDWYDEQLALEKKDNAIHDMARQPEKAQRLMKIEGIGPLTAVTMISTVGSHAIEFKNGREMVAFLGFSVVPPYGQHSNVL